MLSDNRIIARIGAHDVLAQRHEVMFRDGTAVWLHLVHRAGLPHLTLRTLATDSGCHLLFDLAQLQRQLDGELRLALQRDHPGFVLCSMRQKYASKAEFVVDVRRHSLATVEPAHDPVRELQAAA